MGTHSLDLHSAPLPSGQPLHLWGAPAFSSSHCKGQRSRASQVGPWYSHGPPRVRAPGRTGQSEDGVRLREPLYSAEEGEHQESDPGSWLGARCTPQPRPQLGTCTEAGSGVCVATPGQGRCQGHWGTGDKVPGPEGASRQRLTGQHSCPHPAGSRKCHSRGLSRHTVQRRPGRGTCRCQLGLLAQWHRVQACPEHMAADPEASPPAAQLGNTTSASTLGGHRVSMADHSHILHTDTWGTCPRPGWLHRHLLPPASPAVSDTPGP